MREPRIIFFDLETLPILREVLKVFPGISAYPGLSLKASINSILCAGYRVYGEKKTHCINAWDFPTWEKDVNSDRELCLAFYEILKDADAVVTQNGKSFDWRVFQTRLLINGLSPLPKIYHIDLKNIARSNLYLFNNRLNTLGEHLVNDKKMKHEGWEMWEKVYYRDQKAMNLMQKYCKKDVELLEKLFIILKPFIKVPNYNVFQPVSAKPLCPNCGSTRFQSRGTYNSQTASFRRYACIDCGTWFRTNRNDEDPRTL